jgi:hypothetical protein
MTYVEVDSVKDPTSLINKIKNAYVIKKFTVTFGGPNPFDADEHFHKPMSVYLQKAGGRKGRTTIDGENLDSGILIQMIGSVASTGNNATARLKNADSEKFVTVSLKKNPAKIVVPSDVTDEVAIDERMVVEYRKVRNR